MSLEASPELGPHGTLWNCIYHAKSYTADRLQLLQGPGQLWRFSIRPPHRLGTSHNQFRPNKNSQPAGRLVFDGPAPGVRSNVRVSLHRPLAQSME